MTIDALALVTLVAFLARSLTRHNSQRLELDGRESEVVMVRALVGLTGIEVTASIADVVLVAGLHLLDALNFATIVLHGHVHALALLVAVHTKQSTAGGCDNHIFDGAVGILPRYSCP